MLYTKHILITGSPGVGKTTLLKRIRDLLREKGAIIGGVCCPEIKENNKRVGFSIIDLMDNHQGVLALKNASGPKVGSYGVNMEDLNQIGVMALKNALKSADYILIDEIAPMELKSSQFTRILQEVFSNSKTIIAIIHKKSNHELILNIKNRDDVLLFDVNQDNRDKIYLKIIKTLNLSS